MSANVIVMEGVVRPDGVLELNGKIALPPGKVQVTLQPLQPLSAKTTLLDTIQEIRAGQQARGHIPRTAEAIETEQEQLLAEWEEREQEIESLQSEARRLRDKRS